MSKYCPECTMLSYNEEKCDYCGKQLTPKTYTDKFNNLSKYKKPHITSKLKTSTYQNNPILIIAIAIISISLAYLAFDKYQERKYTGELMKMMIGTDNPEKAMKIIKNNQKKINNYNQKILQDLKQFNKNLKNK